MKRTGVQQTEGRDRGVSAYTQAYSFTHPQLLFLCHCLIRGHVDFEGQSCIHTLAKLRSSDFKHLNLNDTFPDKVLEFD